MADLMINQFPIQKTDIPSGSFFGFDWWNGFNWDTVKMDSDVFLGLMPNFANTDLTFTGNRTHSANLNRFEFLGAKDIRFDTAIAPTLGNASFTISGYGSASSDVTFRLYRSGGTTIEAYGDDSTRFFGAVGIGTTPSTNTGITVLGFDYGFSTTGNVLGGNFFSNLGSGLYSQGGIYGGDFVGDVSGVRGTSIIGNGGVFSGVIGVDVDTSTVGSFALRASNSGVIGAYGAYVIGSSVFTDSFPATPDASAQIDLQSTTKGFLTPRMTTVQRDAIPSPAIGLEIFNLTNLRKEIYNGVSWNAVGGSGTVSSVSVVTANGFNGSVATATTTPAITIGTTVSSPVLAGNAGQIIAATTTGTGSVVALSTSPVLITPILGTPTSGTLTNCTGLPISTGVSGLATGMATFLSFGTSADLWNALTDPTGLSSSVVFANQPSFDNGVIPSTTTFSVFNVNATTINAFGAATAINIGAAGGTTTFRSGTIVGTQTTENIFNTVATTGNILGAATTITMGAATGTATIRNTTVALTGGTLTGATSMNVFNLGSSSVFAFGGATTLTMGATTGTTTIRGTTVTFENVTAMNLNGSSPTIASTSTGTLNIFNTNLLTVNAFGTATTLNFGNTSTATKILTLFGGATVNGATKTLNLGVAGVSGSITNINIGSAVSGALGTTIIGGSVLRYKNTPATSASFSTSNITVRNNTTGDQEIITASGGGTSNFLRADGTWASPAAGASTISAMFTANTDAGPSNSSAEVSILGTGLGTKTIAANEPVAGSVYRIVAAGRIVSNGSQSINIRVKVGGNVITLTNSVLVNVSGTRQFTLEALLTFQSIGGGGTVIGSGNVIVYEANNSTSVTFGLDATSGNGTTTAINTTASQAIDVTAQWAGADPLNVMRAYNVTIEKLR